MDAAVVAAWIAAGAAALSAAVNAYFIASSGRRQQENELVVSALTHFVGGSQERSAGLAALKVLSGGVGSFPRDASIAQPPPGSWVRLRPTWFALRARRSRASWSRYAPAAGQLFYRQLIYVLCHGRNRWEAHEIANVVAMADWLITDEKLAFGDPQQRKQLATAMCTYLNDWKAEVKKAKEKATKEAGENILPPRAHYESVTFVTKKINDEWNQKLGGSPSDLSD